MKRVVHLGIIMSMAMISAPAFAGPVLNPSATYTSSALGGGVFDYQITLTNSASSPVSIGTFWFAWTPGKDFLDVAPLSVSVPLGWKETLTHGSASDGYAIQWVANSNFLAAGNSLVFEFTSTETPSQLLGNSPFFPTTPEGTSFVYSGAPFSDAGTQFTVVPAAVPEPPSLVLSAIGGLALIGRKRIGRLLGR